MKNLIVVFSFVVYTVDLKAASFETLLEKFCQVSSKVFDKNKIKEHVHSIF